MAVKNQVGLITYPDSLGGNLKSLHYVLENCFSGIFKGGVHILPPFPSTGDRGFAPKTYLEIDPEFGSWDDIRAIGRDYDVLVDMMVNHISRQSPYVQDYLEKGAESEYADMFLTLDKLWDDGVPVQEDIDKMFLRRPVPYSSYPVGNSGERVLLWTTFGKSDPSEQVDLDIHSEQARTLFREFLLNFKRHNVKIVRLDAVGYVIKKLGTSCFFVEPDIFGFLDWMLEQAALLDMELLPEVHSHYSIQYRLAEHGCWIYDFILPYQILSALLDHDSRDLIHYLKTRPAKQFTMLDCHDGIPVKPDLDDLAAAEDARRVVKACVDRGANLSLVLSEKHKGEDGFDVHQIRCSYYSVLGCDDDAYLSARAIQFFAPGIPQVYYVGLLAGENDEAAVAATGEGREINRHNYSMEEIKESLQKPVVQRLMALIRFRNEYEAFQDGDFQVLASPHNGLRLAWTKGDFFCELEVDLPSGRSVISYRDERGLLKEYTV